MNPAKQPVIIGLGELLWDMLPSGRRCGGAPANFAYHANRLGAKASIASSVGNDSLGHELLQWLDLLQLERKYVAIDSLHPTGTVNVALDQCGKPTYSILEAVAWDYIPWTPSLMELASHADAICFGSLAQRSPVSQSTIQQAIAAASEHCLKVFDVNVRQNYAKPEVLLAGLTAANVLKLNEEELPVLARLLSIEGDELFVLLELVKRFHLKLAVLTKGEQGSILMSDGECSQHPGIQTDVVDTVGAGDAFTAAVVVGLLQGQSLEEINDRANKHASSVCRHQGAIPIDDRN
jgi:fructokinase